jgi:hypothetical protein
LLKQDLHGNGLLTPDEGLFVGVRQERYLSGVLDRLAEVGLVLRARAGDPAGPDLPAFGEETAQHPDVLVVDVLYLFFTEIADLALLLFRIR